MFAWSGAAERASIPAQPQAISRDTPGRGGRQKKPRVRCWRQGVPPSRLPHAPGTVANVHSTTHARSFVRGRIAFPAFLGSSRFAFTPESGSRRGGRQRVLASLRASAGASLGRDTPAHHHSPTLPPTSNHHHARRSFLANHTPSLVDHTNCVTSGKCSTPPASALLHAGARTLSPPPPPGLAPWVLRPQHAAPHYFPPGPSSNSDATTYHRPA